MDVGQQTLFSSFIIFSAVLAAVYDSRLVELVGYPRLLLLPFAIIGVTTL